MLNFLKATLNMHVGPGWPVWLSQCCGAVSPKCMFMPIRQPMVVWDKKHLKYLYLHFNCFLLKVSTTFCIFYN